MTVKSKKISRYDLLKYLALLFSAHTLFLFISGYFNIGLLSDDYMNFISAKSSALTEKFTSSVPYYSNFHFRPIWFLSIDTSIFLNSLFNSSENNFIFFRIENLFWYYLFIGISAKLLFKISGNRTISILFALTCLVFPNNLNNICWTAGKVDIICAVFLVSALTMTYNYISEGKNRYLIYTLLFFLLSLMTKETALTFPILTIVFITIICGKEVLFKFKSLIISEFIILIAYIFYKIIILNNSPDEITTAFQDPGISGSLNLVFKAIISLVIPFDYLTLQNGLSNFDFFIIAYLSIVLIFAVSIFYMFLKNKELKSVIIISMLFLISISPNIIAGYFRPQLILIPFIIFSLAIFIIVSRFKILYGIIKFISTVVFLFWILISYNLIKDWEYASEITKADAGILCKENFDFKNGKKVYVIGLPSRYNQAFILNYVSGQYNYYCNNEFKLIDNISDIIHTGALDKISLNSELKINIISGNEFEIKTTGETQYLLKLDLVTNKFSDKDLEIIFSEFNSFNKPTKAVVKVYNNSSDIYLFSKEKFSLIKLSE